ncbi:MAG TPA: TrpB-like pyridoxal-phosphate dependent enzyme, partial [Candidatus Hydrogenedens sp.]|nr:TrpB-like pyridoxal-phosphate dependent enzyme [Candidatus Hydrogenedens sp.]
MNDYYYTVLLDPAKLPDAWYNINPDLPTPLPPPLHPVTHEPVKPSDLEAIFPKGLIEQEASNQQYISIPGEIMDIYRLWRPTPLRRAYRL